VNRNGGGRREHQASASALSSPSLSSHGGGHHHHHQQQTMTAAGGNQQHQEVIQVQILPQVNKQQHTAHSTLRAAFQSPSDDGLMIVACCRHQPARSRGEINHFIFKYLVVFFIKYLLSSSSSFSSSCYYSVRVVD